ncbi:unnamed protein product [Caenorhabditis auriculariae]|uniref:Uncharacterized protein n=1 Tax=Caenorhabditis auriculariae TaxID=2777116 RepID=A0A8S1HAD3_9PELO|nr:unnamed protein product [Caenorhabditis auriculariae]
MTAWKRVSSHYYYPTMHPRDDDVSTASEVSATELEDVRRQLRNLEVCAESSCAETTTFSEESFSMESSDVTSAKAQEGLLQTMAAQPEAVALYNLITPEAEEKNLAVQDEPVSYYQLLELNKGPVDCAVRMRRVPSQYQLDALSEVFLFDVPQMTGLLETGGSPSGVNPSIEASTLMEPENVYNNADRLVMPPAFAVNSEYVSEMLI